MTTPLYGQAPVQEGEVLASKYRVERLLGQGGMGVVVAARHLDLDELVALKFLLPGASSNEELVGRFLREARASVKLKGAHVAKVLDVGRMTDGRPYIVMEHLDGRDLGAELKHNAEVLPIGQAMSWVLQACEGLAEAHSHGIVHRDLKPGNLFLTQGVDGRPLVKVLDFGISKTLNPGPQTDGLSLTRTEMLLGSPLYMSPEQMRSSKHVDERADIWGLGAIAYELLARRVPFEAETLLDLCFKVAQEDPPPLTNFREVPEALNAAIMRCLSKDPSARHANVAAFAAAIEPFADESYRGSAARASAVLVARPRGRALSFTDETGSKLAPYKAEDARISDSGAGVAIVGSGSASGSQHTPMTSEPTMRAPSSPDFGSAPGTGPGTGPGVIAKPAVSSAPDGPASAAWGTTNAAVRGEARKGRGLVFGLAGVVALAAIGAVVVLRGRLGAHDVPPPVAATQEHPTSAVPITSVAAAVSAVPAVAATASTAPVEATPSPAQPSAPVEAATGTPRVVGHSVGAKPGKAPAPPSAKPSAQAAPPAPSAQPSAKPASSSGFIRERE